MDKVDLKEDALIPRISEIVENLFQSNSFYQERLDKEEMIQHLVNLFKKFSQEEFRAIEADDLTGRINSILVLEATAGILNDLTPEQMEIFDAAVEGR